MGHGNKCCEYFHLFSTNRLFPHLWHTHSHGPNACAASPPSVLSASPCKPTVQSCQTFHQHPSGPLFTIRKGCDDEMQGGATKCVQVVSYRLTVCVASSRSVVLYPVASLHRYLEIHTVITLQELCFREEKLVMMKQNIPVFFSNSHQNHT